jgi:hypothetical protein
LPPEHIHTHLLKRPWSDDQPVSDVHGDADDGRSSYAVTQDDTPVGIIILEKSQLGWAHQKTANDELRQKFQETLKIFTIPMYIETVLIPNAKG